MTPSTVTSMTAMYSIAVCSGCLLIVVVGMWLFLRFAEKIDRWMRRRLAERWVYRDFPPEMLVMCTCGDPLGAHDENGVCMWDRCNCKKVTRVELEKQL